MLLKIGCKDIIKKYIGQIEIKNKINYIRYYAISPRKLFCYCHIKLESEKSLKFNIY